MFKTPTSEYNAEDYEYSQDNVKESLLSNDTSIILHLYSSLHLQWRKSSPHLSPQPPSTAYMGRNNYLRPPNINLSSYLAIPKMVWARNVLKHCTEEESTHCILYMNKEVICLHQGVTKRCRPSLLTNSILVYEPKCGGRGGVAKPHPMSAAAHIEPK
jgi:hypothetical protein